MWLGEQRVGIFEISHDVISSQRGALILWKTVAIERINTFLSVNYQVSSNWMWGSQTKEKCLQGDDYMSFFFSSVKTSAVLMGLSSIRNQLRWTTFCGRVSSHNNQGLFIRFSKVNQSYSETLEIQHILLNELVWNFLHNWFALIMNKLLDNPLSSTHGQLHGHILCKGVIIY